VGPMNGNNEQQWSIGELAAASGVTVRTLHHYDEIGLLPPGGRTGSGHRRYTDADLRRLYRIRALRMLGLSLEEITTLLQEADAGDDSPGSMASWRELLSRQLAALREQAEHLHQLQAQVQDLLHRLDAPALPGPEQVMATLEGMALYEKHFTPDQRRQLENRRAELGQGRIEDLKAGWIGLVEEGLALVAAGSPADGPEARDLVRRWDAIGSAFHSTEGTKMAARNLWQENSAGIGAQLPWPADGMRALVGYLQQARDAG
jgi:MerR family transcriptional regulator, thiopeptide resistance regulator